VEGTALIREINRDRTSVGAARLVVGYRDDRLMESGGVNRGDHPLLFRIEFHETVDGVDANQLDKDGHETKVETSELSFLE